MSGKNLLKIGGHVSIAGGLHMSLDRVKEIGGNCLQIFSTSPRGWNMAKVSKSDLKIFNDKKHNLGIGPIYFHACYLINLADNNLIAEKSVATLIHELKLAKELGVRGSVIHVGSFKGKEPTEKDFNILVKNIKEILKNTPKESLFIIENSGTRKIGKDLKEIQKIIDSVGGDRLRVCLDTCHLHAAGYDLSDDGKFKKFLKEFDSIIGLDKLEVVHMNDSRDDLGSLRDRHENIGKGFVGKEVFKNFLTNPKTKNLPFILEVPGFDGMGPDVKNVEIVKSLSQ
jgi:deoxyribonuclease-4